MEFSFNDGDNFVRNMVTVRCNGARAFQPIARKLETDAGFPISIDDLAEDLRIDSDEEEDTLERILRAAAAYMERRTGYVLIPGRYQVELPAWWDGRLEIMRGPLRDLVGISYLNAAGVSLPADLGAFHVTEQDRSFSVQPLSTFSRPTLWAEVGQVLVTFDAGFKLDDESQGPPEIPDDARMALTMLVGHYYKNRELFEAGILESAASMGILGSLRQYW